MNGDILNGALKKDTIILMIRTKMRNCEHSVGAATAHPLADAWNEISASLSQTQPSKRPNKISSFVPNSGILWDRHLTAQSQDLLAFPSSLAIAITTITLLLPLLILPFSLPSRPFHQRKRTQASCSENNKHSVSCGKKDRVG